MQQIFLPNKYILKIELSVRVQNAILFLTFEKDFIRLFVQKKAIHNLYEALPKREGLKEVQHIGKHLLELFLEVDIRTQKSKRNVSGVSNVS